MEELTDSAPSLRRCSQQPCLLKILGNLIGELQQPEGGVVACLASWMYSDNGMRSYAGKVSPIDHRSNLQGHAAKR